MAEWGVALIAAGSAIAGSGVTGWFTRIASYRQAAAMQLAADRQANALIHTVQETLNDQQVARRLAQRQQAFVEFFRAAEAMRWAQVTNAEERAVRLRDLRQAYLLLQLELFPDEAAGHDVFRELQRLVWDARNPGGSEEMEELYEHSRDRVIELAFQALQRTQSSSHPR